MAARLFHFEDGKSSKFWSIDVNGSEHTVQYGKLGTTGQSKTKSFASDAAAQADADKLIKEKAGKGYIEQGATPSASPAVSVPAPEQTARPTKKAVTVAVVPAIPTAIPIDPFEQLWVTYRPSPTFPPRPEPRPFDQKKCYELLRANIYENSLNLYPIEIPEYITREEARFWLTAAAINSETNPKTFMKTVQTLETQSFASDSQDCELIWSAFDYTRPNISWVFLEIAGGTLLTLESVIQSMQHKKGTPRSGIHIGGSEGGYDMAFRKYLLPYLTEGEKEQLRTVLRPKIAIKNWPTTEDKAAPVEFLIAAALGMHAEIEQLVSVLPTQDPYGMYWWAWKPFRFVLGLGSAEKAIAETKRLKLRLIEPWAIRAWLAHTGDTELEMVCDAIAGVGSKYELNSLFPALAAAKVPAVARTMLQLTLEKKPAKAALDWLKKNMQIAVVGLLPLTSQKGKLAEEARVFLRDAYLQGNQAAFDAAPDSPEKQAFLATLTSPAVLAGPAPSSGPLPKELEAALRAVKVGTFPTWLVVSVLPPITVKGTPLSEAQHLAVLSTIKKDGISPMPALIKLLKEQADATSLNAFAWEVFEAWQRDGYPSKEKWALFSVGALGNDLSALKLTPLIREWPGQSQHQRAVLGLEILRTIGTDTALMQLNGIAQKVKFQGLKNKAKEMMEAIAKDRGMSSAELEDRIVPDLGLDATGSRTFDFGPRQFRMVLDADLAPMIKEADGKLRGDLPKPGAKDDASLATAAVDAWKLLKKQVKETLKIQGPRLENAMVTGRRWPLADFTKLIVQHPLMTNLAQRLIWAAYDSSGKITQMFRIMDDRQFADAHDKPVKSLGAESIGIVHPLNLSEAELRDWGTVLGDYEIVPPFQQLGRALFHVDGSQKKEKNITQFANVGIHPGSIWSGTEKLGWIRGSSSDHGVVMEFGKVFPFAGVTAVMEIEPGIPRGAMDMLGDSQKIERCFFFRGDYEAHAYPYHDEKQRLALGDVHPIAFSEIMADLNYFASKGS